MSGMVEAMLAEANAFVSRTRSDLEEARALGASGGPLVAMLEQQLAKMEQDLRAFEETPAVEVATREYNEAVGKLMRADAAQVEGSTDRATAIRLAGDAEHARQCLRIAKRQVEAAEKGTIPLSRIVKVGRNDGTRFEARGLVDGLVTQAMNNRKEVTVRHDVSLDVAAWEPLYMSKALASYKPVKDFTWSKAQLESVFATRLANHDARRVGAVLVNGEWHFPKKAQA